MNDIFITTPGLGDNMKSKIINAWKKDEMKFRSRYDVIKV
jgi:hypothetical protein